MMSAVSLLGRSIVIVTTVLVGSSLAQPLGYFEQNGDVGQPAITGSTAYDPATQTYTIVGSGTNMWASRDEFQFAWR